MSKQVTASNDQVAANTFIDLHDIGVKYRFLTERQTTLKGRVFSLIKRKFPLAKRDQMDLLDFWAIRRVSLQASCGDVVGLVGPNGAGKSTLLRVVAGILRPSEGHLETRGEIRPLLDVMGTLNPELTGRQNCYLYGALYRIPKSEMRDAVDRIAEFSDLQMFFDVPVKCYSAGMMTRLGFSLAVQFRPEILLIDEVLAVGDEQFQKKSYFKMVKLIESGSLVIVASHNLSFIEQICTTAILLWNGTIYAQGRPKEIVRQYRALVR